jgi:ribosomal protein S18 acetylase RimI-like enzyme
VKTSTYAGIEERGGVRLITAEGLGAVVPLDLSDEGLAGRLLDLQRRAYAVEAGLIGHDGIPQLTETVAELCGAGLSWLGIIDDRGWPVAAVAYSWDGPALDIERLVVDPAAFRRGLARRLLAALPPADVAVVSTGRDNHPARALYERHGFRHVNDVQVVPGLWISRLRRDTPELSTI